MDVWLGGINTAVLLTSSLTMALAVKAAGERQRERTIGLLSATIVLGLVFLGIKAYEYYHKYEHHQMPFLELPFAYSTSEHPGIIEFYNLYFLMTGLHAFHMIIGIVLLGVLAIGASRGKFLGERSTVVHNSGLYWHFVDLVWVYLFPFFYLVAARATATGGHG
jgi:cytochrome c oxidase subunit 3